MADTFTTNLNLTKPEVGASTDTWGTKINADLDAVDAIFAAGGTAVNVKFASANFDDNAKAIFGTGDDLEIFHDGSDSYINSNGADLRLKADDVKIYNYAGTEVKAIFTTDGSVDLYHNNVKKFETSSAGATVTGTLAATLSTAAQPNITSVGTLTGFTSTGIDDNADATAITISSAEKVFIGHTAAVPIRTIEQRVQISGVDQATSGLSLARYQDGAFAPGIHLAKSRNATVGSHTIVQNGDRLGDINFYGSDGTNFANHAATIICEVDGTPGANDTPGRLSFHTTADGSGSATERMRITSGGYILAGTTSSAAANKTGQVVAASGIITTEASITSTNGTVDVTVPSGGIMIVAQSGYVEDAAIFTFKADGGSQGIYGTGIGNSNWAFGTTSEPGGGQRNKVWVQTTNTLRFKDNGYGARTYQLTILSNTN